MTKSTKTLLCTLSILIIHFAIAWLGNQPQDVGLDVPAGKLRSLSFAPFHEGFSPITQTFPLPEHIAADMALLADKTYSIRTYSVRDGMQPTPDFARKHALDVLLGGWLGNGHADNRLEIDTLINTANAHPDVVKRIIVGNEVLLRKDMDIDTLISYIRQVKQAVKQPVTYADVWSSYMQYPQLFDEVDFITIHILPYWEDEPVHIDHAAEHVEKIVQQIADKAHELGHDKPILIGESGWPAAGRQRGQALPSVVNEARFIRELIQVANRHGYDYNIVEAFNQPWKSNSEGVVGANWGLLSIDREPVFPLTGPVNENPDWLLHAAWAGGLFLLIVASYFNRLPRLSLPGLLVFLALAQLFSMCLVDMTHFLWMTSYSDWQRAYTLLMLIANSLLGWLLLGRYHAILSRQADNQALANRLTQAYLFFVSLALYKTYSLALDGRYLSFPIEQFTIPVLGLLGLTVCSWLTEVRFKPRFLTFDALVGSNRAMAYAGFFAYFLSLGAIALVLGETYSFLSAYDFMQAHPNLSEGLPVALAYTLQNGQLVAWLFFVLILSIPFWNQPARKARH